MTPITRIKLDEQLVLAKGLQACFNDDLVGLRLVGPLARVADPKAEANSHRGGSRGPSRASGISVSDVDFDITLLSVPPSPMPQPLAVAAADVRPGSRRASAAGRPDNQQSEAGILASTSFMPLRPDTPSTTCEDATEGSRGVTGKFVDGQYHSLRPGSANRPLPPISPGTRRTRRAW